VKAVILAAGRGERLRPLSDLLPKALLPIAGVPVLETLLAALAAAEVREVRIVVGHLGERVRAFAGDGRRHGLRVDYTEQAERRGSAHALALAADFLDDDVMVLGGDTALGVHHLVELGRFHQERRADAALCLKRIPPGRMARASSVALAPDGRVLEFVEKPAAGQAPGPLAAAMFHVYGRRLREYLARVEPSPRGELELASVLRAMIADGRRVVGLELPRPPDLTDARDLLRENFPYARALLPDAPGDSGP
jgi:NDP-sugar pyrophosphorylase family protein